MWGRQEDKKIRRLVRLRILLVFPSPHLLVYFISAMGKFVLDGERLFSYTHEQMSVNSTIALLDDM